MTNKYVAYVRTSTKDQELGLDAQEKKIRKFVEQQDGTVVKIFSEHESGSVNLRPKLTEAIDFCQNNDARLLIATLCRLSRNASFILSLQDSGVPFTVCDMPSANETTIGIMSVVAQAQLKAIREKTKEGLAVIKSKIKENGYYDTKATSTKPSRRITSLGNVASLDTEKAVKVRRENRDKFALRVMPIISELRDKGKVRTLSGIADGLNARGVETFMTFINKQRNSENTKKRLWKAQTVKNLIMTEEGARA